MGGMNIAVLAAEAAEEESSNFLVPNGTFFVILAIFLVVLTVIGVFVIPPITKVLRARDNLVTKTLAENKQAAELFAAAEADYQKQLAAARLQASSARDDARTEGRKVIDEKRAAAEAEVAATLQAASDRFKQEGDAVNEQLQTRVEALSATLASRIIGVDVEQLFAASTGR